MDHPPSPQQGAPPPAAVHGTRRYLIVWAVLLVLTVTTIVVGRIDLGEGNVAAALGIAVVKASLVALFFMHLWESEGVSRLVFAASLVFLALLALGVVGDVATRLPALLPPGPHPH
jgi:cytochrome c oxidase subunit 4